MPRDSRELREVLSAAVAELDGRGWLTVVDLGRDGVAVWELYRDEAGTPRGELRWTASWSALPADDAAVDQAVVDAVGPVAHAPPLLVATNAREGRADKALERLGRRYPRAATFTGEHPVDRVLRKVIARQPLTRFYELVALRRRAAGRLELVGCQLFPIGARRGDVGRVRVRCLPSDDRGTVFAVAAYSPDTRFQLVSARAVKLPPGVYDLTAELRRPGLVHFAGLPEGSAFEPERRAWSAIVSAVPERLDRSGVVGHLICAVEVSGPADRVERRLAAAARMVEETAAELAGGLKVSLLSYGPHAHHRNGEDVPVRFDAWAAEPGRALAALHGLAGQGPAPEGYPGAARIECVLAEVAARLEAAPAPGRSALLLVGARPPCPPRSDVSQVLPCPRRNDWRIGLARLRRTGVVLAAVRDRAVRTARADDFPWHELGGGPPVDLDDLDDLGVAGLGAALGLLPKKGGHVPLPLLEPW
ncbi:hypothetical protein [Actinomadura chibensis]|uniref:Uncharacterized protein n=1 Tax=Actinomadura chibensis TaxID=392828 RepID=A0A5D0NHR0_9ACTN|nr:hypothetical protein [Actinomadura chibensis]TYB43966.1 hypothetical protein FXF69_23670 [Actinomadura chibensis]